MSNLLTSRRLRWAVPGGVAAAVAVASLSSTVTASASGRPKLPARTAQQLLVAADKSTPAQMSGTVVESVHLGLPELPASVGGSSGGAADLSLQTFLTGSHTLRVFYGGEDQQRVALIGTLSETDVVHNGKDLWTYASTTHKVTHSTLATRSDKPEQTSPSSAAAMTPAAAADAVLDALNPSTTVTVDSTAYVAGRPTYQLLLTPKDSRSLVGSVRIALDSATSMPLRVQVFAKGATSPAVQIGFTDISFKAPDASVFTFIPPAGTITTEQKLPVVGADGHPAVAPKPAAAGAQMLGSGWTAVLEATLPAGERTGSTRGLLDKVSTRVAGGRLVTSALVSVLFTDDGKVLVGAVSGSDLAKVAASGHGL